ncbi:hypothetical protein HDV00_008566 [Rhizophlyctis rosea]|nr:hypothetical protein HDV00_008566 [Rhizophlyctis rosea]
MAATAGDVVEDEAQWEDVDDNESKPRVIHPPSVGVSAVSHPSFVRQVKSFSHQAVRGALVALWRVNTKDGTEPMPLDPATVDGPCEHGVHGPGVVGFHQEPVERAINAYLNDCWHLWHGGEDVFVMMTLGGIMAHGGYKHASCTLQFIQTFITHHILPMVLLVSTLRPEFAFKFDASTRDEFAESCDRLLGAVLEAQGNQLMEFVDAGNCGCGSGEVVQGGGGEYLRRGGCQGGVEYLSDGSVDLF